ncbi:MAG: GNAT family N-acetyltransferase [Bacteroidota bacterium]
MTEVTTRPATLADHEVLLTFEKGIIVAERPLDETLKSGEIHYYDLTELIQQPDAHVVVAQVGEELVGSGYALLVPSIDYRTHDVHAYLGFMYVKPSFRGRGINQLVLDDLIDWAKSRGVYEIQLEVYPDNVAAVRAYEKAGFKPNLLRMRMDVRTLSS